MARKLQLAGVPPAVAALAGAAFQFWPAKRPSRPVADYPEVVHLGDRGLGDVVAGAVEFSNAGSRELVISDVRTSCSCTGLEEPFEGGFRRLDELRIAPGARRSASLRLSVRGMPVGSTAENSVYFRTNDPDRPEGVLKVTVRCVRGGVRLDPDSIVLGTVRTGTPVARRVLVIDNAVQPRSIVSATSSHPSAVRVAVLPPPPGPLAAAEPRETCVGQLEITADTSARRPVDAKITIELDGAATDPQVVSVIGRVVGDHAMTPDSLALPRRSGAGLLYSATCLCRSNFGKRTTVTVGAVPPGVTVTPDGDAAGPVVRLAVGVDPERVPALEGVHTIPVTARSEDGTESRESISLTISPVRAQP